MTQPFGDSPVYPFAETAIAGAAAPATNLSELDGAAQEHLGSLARLITSVLKWPKVQQFLFSSPIFRAAVKAIVHSTPREVVHHHHVGLDGFVVQPRYEILHVNSGLNRAAVVVGGLAGMLLGIVIAVLWHSEPIVINANGVVSQVYIQTNVDAMWFKAAVVVVLTALGLLPGAITQKKRTIKVAVGLKLIQTEPADIPSLRAPQPKTPSEPEDLT